MKTVLIALAAIALTGCASFEQLQEEGRAIRNGNVGNPYQFRTNTISLPSGTYTVRSNRISGTRVYKNK